MKRKTTLRVRAPWGANDAWVARTARALADKLIADVNAAAFRSRLEYIDGVEYLAVEAFLRRVK